MLNKMYCEECKQMTTQGDPAEYGHPCAAVTEDGQEIDFCESRLVDPMNNYQPGQSGMFRDWSGVNIERKKR